MSDPLSITLVPGALPQDGDVITNDILRKIARPSIALAGSIGAATIDDGAVTTAKLADGVLSADATGRAKMADGYVTAAKLAQSVAGDVQQYGAGVYAAGVYGVTLSPARTGSYVAGEVVRFKADTANSGAADVNINSRGAANLYKSVSTELAAGDIPEDAIVTAIYDGTNFQVLAVSGVTSATGRFTSSEISIPSAGAAITAVTHSLGATPKMVRWVLVCKTSEYGYAVDDEIEASPLGSWNGGDDQAFTFWANSTQLGATRQDSGSGTPSIALHRRDAGHVGELKDALTTANWRLKVYAWL